MSNPNTKACPLRGRLAGIDFGKVRIGIAVCDLTQSIASPFDVYNRRSLELDRQYFVKLIESESLVGFVVGLPLHLSGDESEMSIAAREFGRWLNEVSQLPVCFCDERLTTSWANDILGEAKQTSKRRKKLRDKIAAQLILDAFLNSNRE